MGIVMSILVFLVIYVVSFKDDFDGENLNKVGAVAFGILVLVVIVSIASGVSGKVR